MSLLITLLPVRRTFASANNLQPCRNAGIVAFVQHYCRMGFGLVVEIGRPINAPWPM